MLKKQLNKITFRIPAFVLTLTLVMMALVVTLASLTIIQLTQDSSAEKLELLAETNLNRASEYLDAMYMQASMLGPAFSNLEEMGPEAAQTLIVNVLSGMLEDPRIFASFVAFEPNTVFEDTPNGSSFYFYRLGQVTELDTTEGYDIYGPEDYYAVSKDTRKVYVTEPYSTPNPTTGEEEWLVTISVPIINGAGKLLGVANSDIKMEALGALEYDLGGYEQAYQYITTGEGVYLAHTAAPEKVGNLHQPEENLRGTTFGFLSKEHPLLQEGKEPVFDTTACMVQLPVRIEGIDQQWYATYVVSRNELMADANRITIELIAASVIGLLLLSALIVYSLRKQLRPVPALVAFAQRMNEGDLSGEISVKNQNELGQLAAAFAGTARTLKGYIGEISSLLGSMAEGNLAVEVQQDYRGDFAPIKTALVAIVDNLSTAFEQFQMAAEQVSAGADQTAGGAQALAQGATEQAGSIEELSAEISEVSQRVVENAQSAATAREAAANVGEAIADSNDNMRELQMAMQSIQRASQEISKITATINDIAYQTHLLSLNASVEAARSGAAGKGFMVVAEEVRNLASKAAQAAERTQVLVEDSVLLSGEGSRLTEEMAVSIEAINHSFEQVSALITQISEASGQQAVSVGQINQGVEQVAAVVQTNSATAEQSSATSEELASQAEVFKRQVSRFKFKRSEQQ